LRQDLKRIVPWLVLVLLVALLGWMGGDSLGCGLRGAPAPELDAVVRAGEGRGDRVQLSALRGRVVLLDFWAHWCEPCRESVPILNAVRRDLGEEPVSFYGVNIEEELAPRRVISEHERFGYLFPTFHDHDNTLQTAYDVTRLPTLVVVDKEGIVRHRSSGVPDKEDLEDLIRRLL
jgi:thiol-disulfide isomerase/thioredoxin